MALPLKSAIRAIATDRCMNLAEASRKYGRARQVIDTWDDHSPKFDTVVEFCDVLGFSIDELVTKAKELQNDDQNR